MIINTNRSAALSPLAGALALSVVASSVTGQRVPDLRVDRLFALRPAMATANGILYVVHHGVSPPLYPGGPDDGAHVARSVDGGATWESPVRIGTSAGSTTYGPAAAAAGRFAYASWVEDTGPNPFDAFAVASQDGGATWPAAPTLISAGVASGVNEVRLAASGSAVYALFRPVVPGDTYFNHSLDGGRTWLAAATWLGPDTGPDGQIAADGDRVYAVWTSRQRHIFLRRSLDRGTTWQLLQQLSTGASPPRRGLPQVAVDGDSVYVSWFAGPTAGGSDVFLARSQDRGTSWLPEVRLNTNPAASSVAHPPVLAAHSGRVFAAWEDDRDGAFDLYFNRSLDRGATWGAADIRLDLGDAPGASDSLFSEMAASAAAVVVVWQDWRNGLTDVYCNRSLDGGATWLPAAVRLDTGDAPGASSSGFGYQDLDMATDGEEFYVVWEDWRPGPCPGFPGSYCPLPQAFFNIPFGTLPYGTATSGSGGIAPRLTWNGPAVQGTANDVDLRDGLGGAPAALLWGAGPASKISVPTLGGTVLVAPALAVPMILGGTPGSAGAGLGSLPVRLPAMPPSFGANVNVQALLLDPGAPAGFAMSNAVELWIG
ncbi:MAG: sialidase family protein [Planctomycetota bacterium]